MQKRYLSTITRKNSHSIDLMSLEDFNALEETAYLLRSPKNAERLYQSIKQLEDNKVIQHDIIE